MRKFLWGISGLALLLTGGCVWESYREVKRYDLAIPQVSASVRIEAAEFQNRTGAGTNFVFRMADHRIAEDPDAKWILSPGELIPRALNSAFPARKIQLKEYRITGEVDRFGADTGKGEFVFSGTFRIFDQENEILKERFRFVESLAVQTPEAYVEAASRTVEALARRINEAGQ
ncbi:MAG: membrane integrity-associated transporter subunit PqiC [Lentisphaeria bacterium]|nr:membrane integrity-associated transporter subunit PqiC [Lentisphaeria bacterium]